MKRLACILVFFVLTGSSLLRAQCLQIEGILADACNASGQFSEPYNEMVRFKTGATSLPINQLSIAGKGNTGAFNLNKWPNPTQLWHGLVQNANTASKVTAINATIQACGFVKEPPAGVIPANSEVIMVCSQYMNPTSNSFANLNDTIYMVFQDTVSSATQGHFANYNATPGSRTLVLIDNSAACSDTVKYDVSLLSGHTDGDAIEYDTAGNATYVNYGCQAPYIPLTIDAGANQTICFNDSATLNAIPAGLYSSIAWSLANPGYGSFTSLTALTTTFVPSGSAVSPVKVYVTLFTVCGTNVKDSMLVNLTPAPTPVITGSNGNAVCLGSNFVLSVSQQSGTTYSWSPGSASGASYTVSPGAQTIYTVFATNACTTSTATFTLNVNSLPNITALNDTICRGSSVTLTASGASTYSWNTGAGTASVTVSPTVATMYTVTGTDANGCSSTANPEVYVYSLPTLSATSASICPGSTATLTASGAQTYTWSTSQTGGSVSVTPTITVTYTVTGTDINSCSNFTTTTVTVFTPPTVSATSATICPGGTATLTASGATTYTWSTSQSATSVTVSPNAATTYSVVGTDANGCVSSPAIASVSMGNPPVVTVNSPTACAGTNVTLTASGASSYTWSTAQTTPSITVAASATTYTVIGATTLGCRDTAYATITLQAMPAPQSIQGYSVICAGQTDLLSAVPGGPYTYSWSGPSGSAGNASTATVNQAGVYTLTTSNSCNVPMYTYFTVTVSTPTAAFAPNTFAGQAPMTFTFTNSSNGTMLSNYWNFSNGDTSHQINPTETYTAAGTYDVTLQVTDAYGCMDTALITVYVTDTTPPIIIPNIFTPNGDSINDIFMISGKGITYFNCKIYDRWGITLYEWNNVNGGWDGRNASNGELVSDGTYYLLVTYIYGNNKLGVKPGFLQLIR